MDEPRGIACQDPLPRASSATTPTGPPSRARSKGDLSSFLYKKNQRNPMILPVIMEVRREPPGGVDLHWGFERVEKLDTLSLKCTHFREGMPPLRALALLAHLRSLKVFFRGTCPRKNVFHLIPSSADDGTLARLLHADNPDFTFLTDWNPRRKCSPSPFPGNKIPRKSCAPHAKMLILNYHADNGRIVVFSAAAPGKKTRVFRPAGGQNLERKNVMVPQEELEEQRDYCARVRAFSQQRLTPPLAMGGHLRLSAERGRLGAHPGSAGGDGLRLHRRRAGGRRDRHQHLRRPGARGDAGAGQRGCADPHEEEQARPGHLPVRLRHAGAPYGREKSRSPSAMWIWCLAPMCCGNSPSSSLRC